MRLYASAADHLTYRPYRIQCAEMTATLPGAVAAGIVSPIYDILNPMQMSRSVRTIVGMAELHSQKIPFIIENDADVLLIALEIEAYLREARNMPHTEELRLFLEMLMPLREEIHRLQKRVYKRHPGWARRFLGLDSGYINTLYQFMRGAGFSIDKTADPSDVMRQINDRVAVGESLQEKLAAADAKAKIAEQYRDNPASLYDTDVWKV